jgi:hypothetical protein
LSKYQRGNPEERRALFPPHLMANIQSPEIIAFKYPLNNILHRIKYNIFNLKADLVNFRAGDKGLEARRIGLISCEVSQTPL